MTFDRRPTQCQINAEPEQVIEALRPYRAQRIILHGSLARGDWNRASDIDLIIIKETDRPFLQRIGDVLDLCGSAMAVEPLVYTPQEVQAMLEEGNSLLQKALAEGKILYES